MQVRQQVHLHLFCCASSVMSCMHPPTHSHLSLYPIILPVYHASHSITASPAPVAHSYPSSSFLGSGLLAHRLAHHPLSHPALFQNWACLQLQGPSKPLGYWWIPSNLWFRSTSWIQWLWCVDLVLCVDTWFDNLHKYAFVRVSVCWRPSTSVAGLPSTFHISTHGGPLAPQTLIHMVSNSVVLHLTDVFSHSRVLSHRSAYILHMPGTPNWSLGLQDGSGYVPSSYACMYPTHLR